MQLVRGTCALRSSISYRIDVDIRIDATVLATKDQIVLTPALTDPPSGKTVTVNIFARVATRTRKCHALLCTSLTNITHPHAHMHLRHGHTSHLSPQAYT